MGDVQGDLAKEMQERGMNPYAIPKATREVRSQGEAIQEAATLIAGYVCHHTPPCDCTVRQLRGLVDDPVEPPNTAAWRMYLLLALFDKRDTSVLSQLVRSVREGYERENFEDDAWDEFDRAWGALTSHERWKLANPGASKVGVCTDCGGFTSSGDPHRLPFKCGGCDSQNLRELHRELMPEERFHFLRGPRDA